MTVATLDDLDGVGPQLAQAMRAHFKTDAKALDAARRSDVAALAQVPGISERKAIDLIRQVQGLAGADQFLATAAARKVHDELIERIAGFAATAHGRNRLRLLAPLPSQADAERSARAVMGHKAMAARLDREEVRRLLRKVRDPVAPAPRFEPTRMVLCETEDIQERLLRLDLQRWAAVGGQRDLEQAAEYDLVLFLYDDGMDLNGLENVVEIPGSAPPEAIAPEATVAWFGANRDAIASAATLAHLLGRATKATEAMEVLAGAQQAQTTPVQLRAQVEALRPVLDARLKQRLSAISVTGAELMESLGRRIPVPIQKAIDEVLAEGRRELAQATGCNVQPFLPTAPIGIDEEELGKMERQLQTRGRIESFGALSRAAKRLAVLRPAIESELQAWQAFDVDFALGCFAHQFDLEPATFGPALALEDSIHLDLAEAEGAQRIAYHVGREENVALLTGANSGGKTTLLEHMAQLAILARLGLPVVGRVEVPWVEELHYVTARRSLDAGAFESFLRGFMPLAMPGPRRLVLADEVESVTELEAAGRILGFFLDRIATGDSLAVVVSHMAPQILQHCHAPVRIDGIEATGLDAENRLVVDRMPRMGVLARSTPEFIVQRLAATTKGAERKLYGELLAAFRAAPHPPVAVRARPTPPKTGSLAKGT
ncbi:MAG: mismatch repair protein MutS2 [Thermoplasmata archaeon]|nr:mismatch repair protein MutS2 [Thermoplasmata archaeon]